VKYLAEPVDCGMESNGMANTLCRHSVRNVTKIRPAVYWKKLDNTQASAKWTVMSSPLLVLLLHLVCDDKVMRKTFGSEREDVPGS